MSSLGCQVCSAGEKGKRLSQFCSCPSTSSHYTVLLWHTGSGFLWSLLFPHTQNIQSHLLFLPAVSPLLPTTYITIFAPWKNPTHLHNSSCPSLSWASGHKAPGKNWQLYECQQAPGSPSTLLAQSSVTAIHSAGRQECRKGDLHVWDVIAATGHLATSWWQPSACSQTQFPLLGHSLGWLTAEGKQRRVIPPSYKIHNRFLLLMD